MALKNAGGLWLRKGKKGPFLSGSFQPEGREGPKYSFMAFKNTDKEPGSKHPDYKIVVTEDDEPTQQNRGYQQPDDDPSPF